MIEILGLVAMILIGIFVDFVTALISLVVLCAVFTAFIFVYMGTMSLGPLGHLAVNRVRKQYEANAQKGEVVFFGPSNFTLWEQMEDGKAPEQLCEEELRDVVSFACTAAGLSTT